MSRVLQVLEIFEIWICQIFKFCWLQKVTIILKKLLTEHDVGGEKDKVYIKIIDNSYAILTDRIKLDEFKW